MPFNSKLALTRRVLAGLALAGLVCVSTSASDADLEARLAALADKLEAKRQELHIPGMAFAVVKDDKVIMARGFGHANLEADTPVTPDTLFAIGSTSKAFTATIVGMQAGEGKLGFDDKVTAHLPWFEPNLDDATGELTIRDMLSHRSGVARNDILWANGRVDSKTLMLESLDAEPMSPFRKKFNYNNVMFLASGMVSTGVAGADSWHALLDDRILDPLDMDDTVSVHSEAIADPELATGYAWNETSEEFVSLDIRNLDNIVPAGGIYSSASDMTQWLRFNLAEGQWDGETLIDPAKLHELWSSQIQIGGGMHYGMGWFVRDWNGKKVVEHGGNILGYAAQVAMIPEENIGFVLLANVSASPLQQGSMPIVWDTLLGEEKAEGDGAVSDFGPYTGEYIANFGPFKDAVLTVQVADGKLAVDVPGQMLYALKVPDEEGKWYFELTNTIAVSFDDVDGGEAAMMRLHQGGMNFELPRKGTVIAPEIDVAELEPYVGNYTHPKLPAPVRALIQNGRLAVEVPGEMIYELHLPDADDMRKFRINDQLAVKFAEGEDGSVSALAIYRGGNKGLEAQRADSGEPAGDLPSLADIEALRSSASQMAALEKASGYRFTGKVRIVQAGVDGTVTTSIRGKDDMHQMLDFGDYGHIVTALNSDGGATDALGVFKTFHGKYLLQARGDHPSTLLDLAGNFDRVKVVSKGEYRDRPVYTVRLKRGELPGIELTIDSETGDILRSRGRTLSEEIGAEIPFEANFSDFRDVDGVRVAFKTRLFNPMSGNIDIEYESASSDVKLKKSLFTLKD